MEVPYVNGKQHGTKIWYNEDGSKKRELPYVDGQEHGTAIRYNQDGTVYTEEYKWR